jgi:hypothetical protein
MSIASRSSIVLAGAAPPPQKGLPPVGGKTAQTLAAKGN